MNKKFSTLMAAALLVGSFSASAQIVDASYGKKHTVYGPVGSETLYRTQDTYADGFDEVAASALEKDLFNNNDFRVSKIEEGKWYQLEVGKSGSASDRKVLVQLRNYSTGELYLKSVPLKNLTSLTVNRTSGNPSLNSSLWRIKVSKTTEGSYLYKFENKETGYTLSYNCAEASVVGQKAEINSDGKYIGTNFLPESRIVKSGIDSWRWYTKDKTNDIEGHKDMKLYTYDHKFKKIIGLALKNDASGDVISVVADADEVGGTKETQIATDYNILSLTVRNAGVRVLSAADINSMIDADGSWMNKADHYADRDSAFFKNGLKDKDGNEIKINNDLFNHGYKAHEINFADLKIDASSNYAGYNIYLAKKYTDAVGVEYNKYLMVSPNERYENIPATANYGSLVVKDDFFSTYATKKITPNGKLVDGKYVGNYSGDKRDNAFTKKSGTVDALTARYLWKVSYYPTVDSLVFEPLNASVVGSKDVAENRNWEETGLPDAVIDKFYNTVNVATAATAATDKANGVPKDKFAPLALSVVNVGSSDIDVQKVLTVGQSQNVGGTFKGRQLIDKLGKPVVTNRQGVFGLKAQFDHKYTPMTRATVEDGLYFIKVAVDPEKKSTVRRNGMNLVMNLAGRMMYDAEDDYQNYDHMPATQWVIEQDSCGEAEGATPYVTITNREYGKPKADGTSENYSFHGQLYKTSDGKYYFINHSKDYNRKAEEDGRFEPEGIHYYFSCGDTLLISKVEDEEALTNEYVGYKKFDETRLPYETWAIKYSTADVYNGLQNNRYLKINEEGLLVVEDDLAKDFEVTTINTGDKKENYLNYYGYRGRKDGAYTKLPQLKRQGYVLKLRDNNLVDNNWKYLVAKEDPTTSKNNIYYQTSHLKDVDGKNVQLGVFYFKVDQFSIDEENNKEIDAYVPVQMTDWSAMPKFGIDKHGWSGWDAGDYPAKVAVEDLADNENPKDPALGYTHRQFMGNGFRQLGVKTQTTKTTQVSLDVLPETTNDAFIFVDDPRPLYMPIGKEVTNGKMNSTIEFFRTRGAAVENLFEDGHNQSVNKGETKPVTEVCSFLGMTAEGIKPVGKNVNTEFYADSVVSSNPRMPQYLFFVENDSIKDGRWCVTNQHGYFESKEEADQLDKTHHTFYNGYVSGRVLVNLNDSVFKYTEDIDKMDMAAKFAYANMTRLGFVEGIHAVIDEEAYNAEGSAAWMGYVYNETLKKEEFVKLPKGEYLLVLHKDIKLSDLLTEVGDRKDVIDPVKLNKAMEAKQIVWNVLNGKHQNYAFSLRYTDDEHIDVLLESKGRKDANSYFEGAIGTFNQASWLRIENGVPVLAQPYNFNGDHTMIGSSSSMSELINQAQILNVNKGQTQDATANENIAAGNVVVAGVNGAVVVKGAEGKNVIVSTILGKVVANEVVSSDNVTIAAPQGVVVVSVDGESFKVVVK